MIFLSASIRDFFNYPKFDSTGERFVLTNEMAFRNSGKYSIILMEKIF